MSDLAAQLKVLIDEEKALKERLAQVQDDMRALRFEIDKSNYVSQYYDIIRKKPKKTAKYDYFLREFPEWALSHAHLDNHKTAAQFALLAGGMDKAQMMIRENNTEYFDANAIITMSDVEAEFGKNAIEGLVLAGAIEEEKDMLFTVKPKVIINPSKDGVIV